MKFLPYFSIMICLILSSFLNAHSIITDTQITLHDGQFVPRFVSLAGNHLVVPVGQTVTLPAISDFDAIEVAGTLRVSRQYDTVCRFVNLQILPGGCLDMGTTSDPVLRTVEFIVRDRPLDLVNDPYQWGNGIFNLGKWTICGRAIDRTWSQFSPVDAGATSVSLRLATADWQGGDALLVPDTRQMKWGRVGGSYDGQLVPIRRESPVSISSVAGDNLTLSKPLDFEHLAAYSPLGVVRYLPYVANASRNIVIRSENPLGVRGHTVTTDVGSQNLSYAAFIGLGRTLRAPLDNTTILGDVIHVGLNQVAKYPIHWHHAHTSAPEWGSVRGLYVDGTDIAKWGIVVHGTSDVTVEDCVVNRCVGAGFITEDGPEVRNTFEHNFVMGCTGETDYQYLPLNAKSSLLAGIPGGEGSGFWLHGTMNSVRDNVACNNIIGINAFHFGALAYNYPSEPGGTDDTHYNLFTAVPIDFSGNVAFSNAINGLEGWNLPEDGRWQADQMDCWHNGLNQVVLSNGERSSITLDHLRTLATGGVGTALHSSAGYAFTIKLRNSRLEGSATGLLTVQTRYEVSDTTLHNGLNIDWRLPGYVWDGPRNGVAVTNCKATPLNNGDQNIEANFPLPDGIELDGVGYPPDAPSVLPGDYTRNGTVDAADYVVWRKSVGQTGANLPADGNHDGIVDQIDYNIWRANFGRTNDSDGGGSNLIEQPPSRPRYRPPSRKHH